MTPEADRAKKRAAILRPNSLALVCVCAAVGLLILAVLWGICEAMGGDSCLP